MSNDVWSCPLETLACTFKPVYMNRALFLNVLLRTVLLFKANQDLFISHKVIRSNSLGCVRSLLYGGIQTVILRDLSYRLPSMCPLLSMFFVGFLY